MQNTPDGPMEPGRRAILGFGFGAIALALAGCTSTPPPPSGAPSTGPDVRPFSFGTAADALTLDPALAADNESFRITRQVFEGLVGLDSETGAPVPSLATEWSVSDDGLQVRFTLRENVKFHDGTDFNAAAVVANFKRWAALPAPASGRSALGFEAVFRHYEDLPVIPTKPPAEPEPDADATDAENAAAKAAWEKTVQDNKDTAAALDAFPFTGRSVGGSASYYGGIKALNDSTVLLTLRRPLTGLIDALTLPGFGLASPQALITLDANTVNPTTGHSPFGKSPVGTGPYRFESWDAGTVNLDRNTGHWLLAEETAAGLDKESTRPEVVHFIEHRTPSGRLRALLRKDIDGFDMVTVDGLRDLVREGQLIVQRDPFSVSYLGMNSANPLLSDPIVRRAIAHAIDRQKLIGQFYIDGTKEARGFIPPSLGIKTSDTYYGYDLPKAKELLAQSGYTGEPIPFLYPLNIARAYLPLPELIYAELSRQLTAAGLNIVPVPIDWSKGYLGAVLSGEHAGLHLLGYNGSYRDPDDFVGSLFGSKKNEFGYNSPAARAQILLARSMPNGPERIAAYERLSDLLATDLPAIPLTFPISALAFADRVRSYPSSPVLDEVFDKVTLTT